MSRQLKKIIIECEAKNFLAALSMCCFSLKRKPETAEKLLLHMLKKSEDNRYYNNGSGKRLIAMRELGVNKPTYYKAFNALVKSGTIIKIPNDKRNNLCYFEFCKTIIKNLQF